MRISDWSSDVCSSDLGYARGTIAPAPGMAAAVPPLDARTWLEPVDMMGAMATMGAMGGDAHAGHGMTEMPARARHARTEYGSNTDMRVRSEEHTSELQSLMRISYAVFCLKKKKKQKKKKDVSRQKHNENHKSNSK